MKYTYTKTTKNILDFFNNKVRYTYTKLDGIIYKDEANNVHFQNVDMELDIEKGVNEDSQFFTINQEMQYRPDRVAYIAYGDETLAWLVLRFNEITDPFELEIGKIIEVPSLSKVNTALQKKRQRLQYR
jgi:hypothetical protein